MSQAFRILHTTATGIAAAVLLGGISGSATAAEWKPTDHVEIVVGVSPGGSMDRTARTVRDALVKAKLIPESSVVVNKPGGGHAVAFAYTQRQTGNPHFIQVVNSPVITNKLLGRSPIDYKDFTALGVVFSEKSAYAVRVDSTIKDARDLLDRLRKDPTSMSFSVSSGVGTVQHFSVVQLGRAAGVDIKKLKTVSFQGAAEGVTATLGGHVDVLVTTPFAILPFVESEKLRFIAAATDERLGGPMKDVPTWKELGIDSSFNMWRGVIGPKGLKPEQIAFWEKALKQITSTEEWKKNLEQDFLSEMYLNAADTAAIFAKDEKRYHDLLVDLGVISN